MFLDFSYYFMHLFSSHVLGVSNLCQYTKETKWAWTSVPCWSKHKLHPYQIGGISLLAINCSLILMENTITKWSSVRFLHETVYSRIL